MDSTIQPGSEELNNRDQVELGNVCSTRRKRRSKHKAYFLICLRYQLELLVMSTESDMVAP